jgi:uncharacterized protein (TIGR04255 family)
MTDLDLPRQKEGSRRYPRAPIVEAVLDLGVSLPDGTSLERLAEVGANDAEYPIHEDLRDFTGTFNVDPAGVSTHASQEIVGHVWRTPDGARQYQARLGAFRYLQRAPYRDWTGFLGEAERLWTSYKSVTSPIELTRVGARFVNRIDIPLPSVELTEYLLTTAEVPPELPQLISGYFMQMQLPQVREGVQCNVISTLLAPASPATTSLMLDIDVRCAPHLKLSEDAFERSLQRWLAEIRQAKNDVFEACITDKTRRLFL